MQVSKEGLVKILFNQETDLFRDLWLGLKGDERRLSTVGFTSMDDFLSLFVVELVPEGDSENDQGQGTTGEESFSWEVVEVT